MTESSKSKVKAIALMSGGLDSNLAVRIVHDLGVEIIGVHFTGPFCMCNRGAGGCVHFAKKISEELGLRFMTSGLGPEYIEIVVHPKHGRGSGMNPCVDCRILMLSKAKELMVKEGASFILTGEVLGQRPMSQLSAKLRLIESAAGLEGLILRPLSAHLLPPTIVEKQGLVDRTKLLGIEGRGRRTQIDLAAKLELGDYPCPAGGCLLTDKSFAARLREHLAFHGGLTMADLPLLKTGRHFRLPSGAKLVVGRDQKECERLEAMGDSETTILQPVVATGPTAIRKGAGPCTEEELQFCAQCVATYCDGTGPVLIVVRTAGKPDRQLTVERSERSAYDSLRA